MTRSLNAYVKAVLIYRDKLRKMTDKIGAELIEMQAFVVSHNNHLFSLMESITDNLPETDEAEELQNILQEANFPEEYELEGVSEYLVNNWGTQLANLDEYVTLLTTELK